MQIWSHRTRISGTDHLRRTNSNGRRKIGWYQGVASANNCETSSLIPRICKFLLKIFGHYAEIAKPINALTQKDKPFVWTKDCQQAFETLKEKFLEEPVLKMIDPTKQYVLET